MAEYESSQPAGEVGLLGKLARESKPLNHFTMGNKLEISFYLFNHHYSNNPKILKAVGSRLNRLLLTIWRADFAYGLTSPDSYVHSYERPKALLQKELKLRQFTIVSNIRFTIDFFSQ